MKQSIGFEVKQNEHNVLSCLKQLSKLWYLKFNKAILSFGLK